MVSVARRSDVLTLFQPAVAEWFQSSVGFNILVAELLASKDLRRHEELRKLGPDARLTYWCEACQSE